MLDTRGRQYNKNLLHLMESYISDVRGVVLEGSSRSGKSWSVIDFLVWVCASTENPLDIIIVRETAASFRTTLYLDFKRRLSDYGISNPFITNKQVTQFKIFDSNIQFIGADSFEKVMGAGSDILWINEAMSVSKDIFDNLEMRCRGMFIQDFNPISSVHYIFDSVIPRDDVSYLHTTFKDNPFISKGELSKIESYAPTEENKRQGTYDEWAYKVFYLGQRMPRTGAIYPQITWIEQLPELDYFGFGLDFGMISHNTVLTVAGVKENNLYGRCLFYTPTPNVEMIHELIIKSIRPYQGQSIKIFADSANPYEIAELNQMSKGAYHIYAVHKFNGSVLAGIKLINSYKSHLVQNRDVIKESENYVWDSVNGIQLDRPVKDFDDFFDAFRYNVLSNFRKKY